MNKESIRIGDILYWNTTGAHQSQISLKCKVLDVGKRFIWVLVYGNLGPTSVELNDISIEPIYKVTNNNIKGVDIN